MAGHLRDIDRTHLEVGTFRTFTLFRFESPQRNSGVKNEISLLNVRCFIISIRLLSLFAAHAQQASVLKGNEESAIGHGHTVPGWRGVEFDLAHLLARGC
jgi:hypothetical protein